MKEEQTRTTILSVLHIQLQTGYVGVKSSYLVANNYRIDVILLNSFLFSKYNNKTVQTNTLHAWLPAYSPNENILYYYLVPHQPLDWKVSFSYQYYS